jgi:hypothetical protein
MEPPATIMKQRSEMKIQIPTFFRNRTGSVGSAGRSNHGGGLFDRNETEAACSDMEDGSLSGFEQPIQLFGSRSETPDSGVGFFSFRSRESSFTQSDVQSSRPTSVEFTRPRPTSVDFTRSSSSNAFSKFSTFLSDAVSGVSVCL